MIDIKQLLPKVNIPMHVLSISDLQNSLDNIKTLVEQKIDTHDINILGDYLEELSQNYTNMTNIVASAKYYKALIGKHSYEELVALIKSKELPTEFNGLVSSSAVKQYIHDRYPDFVYMVTESEMVDRGLSKRITAIITLLSKEKEIYKHTMFGTRQK
jgi:hypothetical protein